MFGVRSVMSAACLGAVVISSGCASFGLRNLEHDQVQYGQSLDRAQKRQTLANIVNLRYADTPSFLRATSIITAYSVQGSANATISGSTANATGTTGTLGGAVDYYNHPTFTFTPTSGEELAEGYIRPLAPALVLPLIQSGVPIDLLLRIVAQSIGDLRNSAALAGADASGDAGFFQLIHAFRRLQLQGALTTRFERDDAGKNHLYLSIDTTRAGDSAAAEQDAKLAYRLLKIAPTRKEIEIVYGTHATGNTTVGIITRSVLGILTEIGAQIDVPDADVQSQATFPTVRLIDVETRPTVIVHVGPNAPDDAYARIRYGNNDYWIARADFDSKYAFSVVQNLIALAQGSSDGKAPLLTLPAG